MVRKTKMICSIIYVKSVSVAQPPQHVFYIHLFRFLTLLQKILLKFEATICKTGKVQQRQEDLNVVKRIFEIW